MSTGGICLGAIVREAFVPGAIGRIPFRCCVLGQGTSLSRASVHSGVNQYLVRQIWKCVRCVVCSTGS